MEGFEFVGASNGEAIVRHVREGHVFRFKPGKTNGWTAPSLSRAEKGIDAESDPEQYIHAAFVYVTEHVHGWLDEKQ